MNFSKKIVGLTTALVTLATANAMAAGNIWMDENSEIKVSQYKKVILFPLRYLNATEGKATEFQGYNNHFHKTVNKRIKKTNFLGFGEQLEEKKFILRDNPELMKLLGHYNTESDRAKAVYDITGADGYLVPHIRWEKERIDHSPATWTRVKLESYYDETNGPKGNLKKQGYASWYADHLIPAHDSTLQMLDMDFVLYDASNGQKAMTLVDYYRSYSVDQWHAFKQITKNFTGDWSRLKKDHDNNVPANAPTLGFGNITLPREANQAEFSIKTIFYCIKDEAGDRLKGVKVDYKPNSGRYLVEGAVTDYTRGETWIAPSASTGVTLDHETKFKWYTYDAKGNKEEHEGKRTYYKPTITDHYGYYSFWYRVGVNLRLVDTQTGQVVCSVNRTEKDSERYANALRTILKDFYKEVDKKIGVKK